MIKSIFYDTSSPCNIKFTYRDFVSESGHLNYQVFVLSRLKDDDDYENQTEVLSRKHVHVDVMHIYKNYFKAGNFRGVQFSWIIN